MASHCVYRYWNDFGNLCVFLVGESKHHNERNITRRDIKARGVEEAAEVDEKMN